MIATRAVIGEEGKGTKAGALQVKLSLIGIFLIIAELSEKSEDCPAGFPV